MQKLIKMYIQNGWNKRVYMAKNYTEGMKNLLNELLKENNKLEHCEISPITICSDYGFITDIEEVKAYDKFDDIRIFKTSKVLKSMGRKDVAKYIDKYVKTCSADVTKLVNAC